MKSQTITAYTVLGLLFVTMGFTLFGDQIILQYSFMGAGMLMLIYSALKGLKTPDKEQK